MKSRKKQIALFGGSFNPPHEGHREIVRRIARRKSIDEVWILPVWRHPFGKRLAAFDKRVAACRRYFFSPTLKKEQAGALPQRAANSQSLRSWIDQGGGFYKKIKIKTYEKRPRATGYTIDLIHYLKEKFPAYRFWWVMGADAYKERKKWRDFNRFKKLVRLIIFPRGPRSPIPHISSTQIRRGK